jgi:hypothetical protein
LHAGLSVEDLGRGKYYTNTPRDPSLSPGTFVFRPPVASGYFHENPRGFAAAGMLYHPVKPANPSEIGGASAPLFEPS